MATFIPLTDAIQNEPEFEVSRKFIRTVEQQSYAAPEYYLWTHKRWKHKKE